MSIFRSHSPFFYFYCGKIHITSEPPKKRPGQDTNNFTHPAVCTTQAASEREAPQNVRERGLGQSGLEGPAFTYIYSHGLSLSPFSVGSHELFTLGGNRPFQRLRDHSGPFPCCSQADLYMCRHCTLKGVTGRVGSIITLLMGSQRPRNRKQLAPRSQMESGVGPSPPSFTLCPK